MPLLNRVVRPRRLMYTGATLKCPVLGRFRPHHGFLFGTATSLFGLACLDFPVRVWGTVEFSRSAIVMASVIAFWNWLYDAYAIKTGFLIVYNRMYHEGRGPAAIASAYCPVFFGVFGFCYGLSIRVCEYFLVELGRTDLFGWLLVGCNLVVLTCPVLAYVAYSLVSIKETGLRSYEGVEDEG
jgi:hypothetical protein